MKRNLALPTLAIAIALLTGTGLRAGQSFAAAPEAIAPLQVGSTAPTRVVAAPDGPIDLSAVIGHKPTILVFYRAHWCSLGTRELAYLKKSAGIFESLGFQIVAVSLDRPETLQAEVSKSPITLLADPSLSLAADYGVAFRATGKLAAEYTRKGIELPAIPGEPGATGLLVPSVFVVDSNGIIRWVYSNGTKNPSSTELINAAVRART